MQLGFEQVARLAPDEKSLAAARQSMSLRLWTGLGRNTEAVWGNCAGSALYEVAIDLKQFGYRCTCPSRKRPCRHVLGLMLLVGVSSEAIPEAEPQGKTGDWLLQRRARSAKSSEVPASPAKPVDREEQQKRAERRSGRIAKGIEQLDGWLCDIVHNGLAGIELQGPSIWENQARRLVDAQAGGMANRVLSLGEIPASSPDWPGRLLNAMGRLSLLLEAHSRLDELPDDLQSEIRQLIGWTVGQQELDELGERVHDLWVCIAQQETDEERLRVQRTWFQGMETGRIGLVLQFAPGRQAFPESYLPGTTLPATLIFYPGRIRLRAKILDRADPAPFQQELTGFRTLDELLEFHADQLAMLPWHARTPAVLKTMTLSQQRNQWYVRDHTGAGVPLHSSSPWQILALTGGHPADFVVEWNGTAIHPLSIVLGATIHPLPAIPYGD